MNINLNTKTGLSFAIIDDEDYHLVKGKVWKEDDKGYVCHYTHDVKTRLHRLVMGITDSQIQIDHIDRNKRDNRKVNLRICSSSENKVNQNLNATNTSGYKGVYWDKKSKKWRTQICINHKQYTFLPQREIHYCAFMYNVAAKLMHKHFAYLNEVKESIDENIQLKLTSIVVAKLKQKVSSRKYYYE